MITKLLPKNIRLDGGTQPRAQINQAVCDEYTERMQADEKFPPIDVFYDGENYWLADGFHRLRAFMTAKSGEAIESNLYQGSLQDAQWHSYSVNKAHGIRRTNTDKKRAVMSALGHPEGQKKSDRQIAEHVGVDNATVSKYRHELESTVEIQQSPTRTGRDGRTINTTKIGKGKRRKAARPRSAAEYYEAKKAGRRVARPESMVKLELPNNHTANCAYDLLRYFTFEYLQLVFEEIVRINQERQIEEKKS